MILRILDADGNSVAPPVKASIGQFGLRFAFPISTLDFTRVATKFQIRWGQTLTIFDIPGGDLDFRTIPALDSKENFVVEFYRAPQLFNLGIDEDREARMNMEGLDKAPVYTP